MYKPYERGTFRQVSASLYNADEKVAETADLVDQERSD